MSPRKRSRRRPRGVVDTSVLLAGVAGFRNVGHNASASLLKRWVSDNTFTWLISEQILDEYKEVLARQKVRREVIGRIINLMREEASLVPVKRTETVSPGSGGRSYLRLCRGRGHGLHCYFESSRFSSEKA